MKDLEKDLTEFCVFLKWNSDRSYYLDDNLDILLAEYLRKKNIFPEKAQKRKYTIEEERASADRV